MDMLGNVWEWYRDVYDAEVCADRVMRGGARLLVAGYAAHGFKDLWQHRTRFVTGTRWWPPFCAAVDFLVATIHAVGVVYGMGVRGP